MSLRLTNRETARWLLEGDNYLILTHIRPDGDTVGCAAALCAALQKRGKTAWCAHNLGVTRTHLQDIAPYVAPEGYRPERILAVDIATEGLFPPEFGGYKGKVALCIDHHPSNTGYADRLCLDPEAAACGEILYEIIGQGLEVMDGEIAKPLYVAISTDTGCFANGNTTPRSHAIAARLMEYGDFAREVNKRCFQTKSRRAMELEARLLASARYYEEGKVVIGATSLRDMEETGASEGDSENLSNLLRQVEGVRAAANLKELSPGVWKVSLRTETDYVNANKACALLGGGGHPAASGATVTGVDREEMERRVLAAIQKTAQA